MTNPIWDELSTNIQRITDSAFHRGRITQAIADRHALEALASRHPEIKPLLHDLLESLAHANLTEATPDETEPIPPTTPRARTPKPKATSTNRSRTVGQATKRKSTPTKTQQGLADA